jgi:Ca2+-binding EF-hand superfamily protein
MKILNATRIGAAVGAVLVIAAIGTPTRAMAQTTGSTSAFSAIDTDHDGSIDSTEALKAASAKFDAADTDHDGTLSKKELAAAPGGANLVKWFAQLDPDNDGTISKDEYLAAVRRQFAKADPDKDGTVSAAEWKAPAARGLRNLVTS